MPQPIRKKCRFEISGLRNRPEHAKALGEIVAISGRLESALAWLMAILSGGSAEITTAMFNSVVSTDAQRSMLMVAATAKLRSTELDAFNDLMEDFRPRYRERNKVVHNCWGHSDDHPDKALWLKSSDAAFNLAKLAAAQNPDEWNEALNSSDLSTKCMAYTVNDLQDVAARLEEYRLRVTKFVFELLDNHPVLVQIASASTNAPPIGEEPQLDLHQPNQTDPQLDQPK